MKKFSKMMAIFFIGFSLAFSPIATAGPPNNPYLKPVVMTFFTLLNTTLTFAGGCAVYYFSCKGNPTNFTEFADHCELRCDNFNAGDCVPRGASFKVSVPDKNCTKNKKVKNLVEGDLILTGYKKDPTTNKLEPNFEPVLEFLHAEDGQKDGLEISFNDGSLKIYGNHMVKVVKKDFSNIPNGEDQEYLLNNTDDSLWLSANKVKEGDHLLVAGEPRQVTKIVVCELDGFFAPLTKSGQMIVDGTQISCFSGDELSQNFCRWYMYVTRTCCGLGNQGERTSKDNWVAVNPVDNMASRIRNLCKGMFTPKDNGGNSK